MKRLLIAALALTGVGALALFAYAVLTEWAMRILGNVPEPCSHIDGCRADCMIYAPMCETIVAKPGQFRYNGESGFERVF